jgi:hypothetical protein
MSIKQLNLPSIYENRSGNPELEQFVGRPKLSYSAYNSFKEPAYKGEFFGVYFLGEPRTGTIFTEYGSAVGMYQETGEPQEYLSQSDKKILDEKIGRPKGAIYEKELVIDRGSYVIQCFVDRILEQSDGGLEVIDFKTGDISKKRADYESEDYQQTTLYSYGLELLGYKVSYSGVKLANRKGNTLNTEAFSKNGDPLWLRLTGEVIDIPTPYSKERAEKFLKSFDKTAKDIEEYYSVYQKYFGKKE